MLDWLRPVTDFLNIILFLGPIFIYDYIVLIKFNVLNTAGGPWWHDVVLIGTMSLFFYGIGKLVVFFAQ